LIGDGATRDAPSAVVATEELPAAIMKYARAQKREARHV
jgi:hypothetical protein